MEQAKRMLASRYELRQLIGRGGMAEVRIGYDTRLNRTVAIKMLRQDLARDPIFQTRFAREAQSAANLNHPSIVAVYDTGQEAILAPDGMEVNVPYIVMEYVEGHTVRELLTDGDPVPIDEALEIVSGVLGALEYSHRNGLVHRDIKPGNVMLTTDGKVKVMDFGIARALTDSGATMTQTDAVVGTAQYLSPEQARGEQVDTRSDLYSTGCLLFELLTGRPPFKGDSAVAVAFQHVQQLAPTPSSITPDIPEALDRVVMKSLAKNREDRYADAEHMRSDLLRAMRGGAVQAPQVDTWTNQSTANTTVLPAAPPGPVASNFQRPGAAPSLPPTQVSQNTSTLPAAGSPPAKKSKLWLWILLGVLIAALIAVSAWLVLKGGSGANDTGESVVVPELTDMDTAQVSQTLQGAGLIAAFAPPEENPDIAQGKFVSCDPKPGEKVKKGSKIKVVMSKGPGEVAVPNVARLDQAQAGKMLEAAGLKVGSVQVEDSGKVEKGSVLRTDPAADTKVAKGTNVTLIVASGNVMIPGDFVGKSSDEVTKWLTDNKLVAFPETRADKNAKPGTVIEVNPSGRLVPQGSTVKIVIAQAPAPVDPTTAPPPTLVPPTSAPPTPAS